MSQGVMCCDDGSLSRVAHSIGPRLVWPASAVLILVAALPSAAVFRRLSSWAGRGALVPLGLSRALTLRWGLTFVGVAVSARPEFLCHPVAGAAGRTGNGPLQTGSVTARFSAGVAVGSWMAGCRLAGTQNCRYPQHPGHSVTRGRRVGDRPFLSSVITLIAAHRFQKKLLLVAERPITADAVTPSPPLFQSASMGFSCTFSWSMERVPQEADVVRIVHDGALATACPLSATIPSADPVGRQPSVSWHEDIWLRQLGRR